MSVKWCSSAAFVICLAAVAFGDEPRSKNPSASSSTGATPRASSTQALIRQAIEQLDAASKLEESAKADGTASDVNRRSPEEATELSRQIADLQKQIDRLRELTGRPNQIEFRFRVLEIPTKLAAELSKLGTQPLTDSLVTSLYKDTAELNKRIRECNGVKTLCDTSIVSRAGRPASFHSGGKFPIPVLANENKTTIVWDEFGNRCELVSHLLDTDRLRVEFQAETSECNLEYAVVIAGITVPGKTLCSVNTQVEMNLGETMVFSFQAANAGKSKATNAGKSKAKTDPAAEPVEAPVTLFTLTPTPIENHAN